jgi:L-ascorbate metabolism protein UlaG (beta-lactamase superfamily)
VIHLIPAFFGKIMSLVYLKPNIQVEPLVDSWYAWPHLIHPATAARNLTERHIPIMRSYISGPQIHANAVKNPNMLGGPFIDYDGKRVDEIAALLKRTLAERSYLVALSKALADLDLALQANAKGESLHSLYPLVPEPLRGYVELVYDLNNHPSFRIIESLLFRSPFHRTDGQSVMLSEINGDDRPFILSTPRLPSPGLVQLNIPFHDEAIDRLFASKSDPKPFDELLEHCRVAPEDHESFRSLFTSEEPQRYSPYQGHGVRWRYFGHACILLETPSLSMLFDPVLSYTYQSQISRYTYKDLPDRIDYVVITHNHQDHVLMETLLQLRHRIGCVVVPRSGGGALQDTSLKLTLESMGFSDVLELDELQTLKIDSGSVTGIPFLGEHSDLNVRSKLAYLVELKGQRLMFAADSCNVEPILYKHIRREFGEVRSLFVGMECDGAPLSWLYGPLLSRRLTRAQDESRRLSGSNCAQAIDIIDALGCKEVFVYAMGQEPWLNFIMSIKYTPESKPIVESNRLIEACRQRGILAERLFGEREMLLG